MQITDNTPLAALTVGQFKDLFKKSKPQQLQQPEYPEIYDANICSKVTGYSKQTIYQLTSEKKIPHFKQNGKKLFFKHSEIIDWLLSNKVETVKEYEQRMNKKLKK